MIDERYYKDGLKVRIYHPKRDDGRALIHIHGGGFMRGGINQIGHWCEYLADSGWTAVAFEYRSNDSSTIEEAIQDVEDALHWWASQYPDTQAYLCGNSAGAYLVAWQCIFDKVPFRVPVCIMLCPVTDIRTKNRNLNFRNRKTINHTIEDRQRLSIINHVDKRIETRFLITHGRNDTVVPFQNSVDFYDRLRVHNDCRFLPHDGGHPHWKQPENLGKLYADIMEFIV